MKAGGTGIELRRVLLVVCAALLLVAAFPKLGWHPLVWVALAPLLLAIRGASPGSALTLGWLFGVVYRAGTLYWLVYAMTRFGGLGWATATVAAALLVAYLAVYPSLACLVASRADVTTARGCVLVACAWVGSELLQARMLTGFPWTLVGYPAAATDVVAQAADLAGVYGLGFVALLVNAGLAGTVLGGRRSQALKIVVLTALGLITYGGVRLASAPKPSAVAEQGPTLTVGLVQGNVTQDLKWDTTVRARLVDRHLDLSARAAARGAQLVVWPESSWPDPYGLERDEAAAARVRGLARSHHVALLVGTVHVQANGQALQVANSALLVQPDGQWGGRYDKVHLVPFGEYLPWSSWLTWLGPLVRAVGQLQPGDRDQPLLQVGPAMGGPFGLAICYEVVFPEIVRRQVRAGARFLVTITNDAWYGHTSGPYQHFAMARLRAIETHRYLVRAANTGISGIVDPWGRVLQRTPLDIETVVVGTIAQRTGFTWYVRTGDALAWACLVVLIAGIGSALGVPGARWGYGSGSGSARGASGT